MTAKKGTTWATVEFDESMPHCTDEDVLGMYLLEMYDIVWRLKSSDNKYTFLEDEIVKDEIYTLIRISCSPIGLQSIDGTQVTMGYFEEGMTWANWVESCHNKDYSNRYYFDSTGLTKDDIIRIASDSNGTLVTPEETISSILYYEYQPTETKNYVYFSIGGIDCVAEKGMTWEQWSVSEYYTVDIITFDDQGTVRLKSNPSMGVYTPAEFGCELCQRGWGIELSGDYVVM